MPARPEVPVWNFLWEQWPHREAIIQILGSKSQMIKTWFLQQINIKRKWGRCTRAGGGRVLQKKDINRGRAKPKVNVTVSLCVFKPSVPCLHLSPRSLCVPATVLSGSLDQLQLLADTRPLPGNAIPLPSPLPLVDVCSFCLSSRDSPALLQGMTGSLRLVIHSCTLYFS